MKWYWYGRGTKKEIDQSVKELRKRGVKTKAAKVAGSDGCCLYTNKPIMSTTGKEWHEFGHYKGNIKPLKFVD